MRWIGVKVGSQTISRFGARVLLLAAIALAGTGLGCAVVRPMPSANGSVAPQPADSRETTQSIKAQMQARIMQRSALADELNALDVRIAAESGSPTTSASTDKLEAMRPQRSVLVTELDTLETVLEAETERYNALQPSAPVAKP